MARSFHIRPARADDAPEIARLATELGYPATPAEMEPRLAAILPRNDRLVAVAEDSSPLLLGWVAAERRLLLHYDARAELIGLVVGSNARRRGVGRALVFTAEEWTVAQGLPGIFVRSSTTRIESHPFYESLGYRRNKTQHSYFKTLTGRSPGELA